MERCALKKFCVGTIDCLKPGFELGKRFKGATNCVVSCCDGDNCDPPTPLKCYQCQGKGDIRITSKIYHLKPNISVKDAIYFHPN